MNNNHLKNLPKGWFIANEKKSENLHKELLTELPLNHILYGVPLKVVAHRNGATDDILCNYIDEPERFTIVHLSWSGKREPVDHCPTVEVDGSFKDFLKYEESFTAEMRHTQK